MYVVRDKKSKKVLHINPAPLSQALEPKEVYARFDPKKMEIGKTDGPLPERFDIGDDGELVSTRPETAPAVERLQAPETQKIVEDDTGARLVDKSTQELVDDGLMTLEDVRERKLQSLRGEVSAHFQQHKTPGGYRLDDLARQKASFSAPFRQLPDTDEQKKDLLEAGLIYPDDILDEILDEVGKIQTAYRAAKKAVTTAFDKGQAVETWEAVSLQDHLPDARKKKAPKKRASKKAGSSKKRPSGKKSSSKKTSSKKKTKGGSS